MKIVIPTIKPRNPLVAPARFRVAGSHRSHHETQRREGAQRLRRELDALKKPPP